MVENIRFGIIGTGNIAKACHGPALQNVGGVTLWSVLSRDIDRAAEFARAHGATAPHPAYNSLEDFLSDPLLQAVIITSPDNLHAQQIIACARARKHVFVEKPMVTSYEDGEAAITACADQGVKLGVGFHLRWHAGHRELHRLVTKENALGDLQDIQIKWMTKVDDNTNWRASPELGRWWSLAANGSHCIDLMHWFADSGDRSLSTCSSILGKEKWGGPHEETVDADFVYSDGLTAKIMTSVVHDPSSLIKITGTKGKAVCEGTLSRFSKGSITINSKSLAFEAISPFQAQIADFATAIRDNRDPEVNGVKGLMVVNDMIKVEKAGNSNLHEKIDLQSIKKMPLDPSLGTIHL
jgi:1,5-anhydro-D-fructose reductase (1,5-anhydro-D-mannitol-forming)